MSNAVLENIKERSSTRAYTSQPLTKEQIQTLVDAALQAPTARNDQELFFTVMDGNSELLKEINADFYASRGVSNPTANFYYSAPLVILISARENYTFEDVDAGIAVENLALASESMGLGNVIIGCIKALLNGDKKAEYDAKLGIPEGYSFKIAIAIGYKGASKVPHEYNEATLVKYID